MWIIGDALSGIVKSLNEFSVDSELIDEVVKSIQSGLDSMPKDITPVSGPSFGTLPGGVEMARHTANARDFMLETYQELERLLTSYATDIKDFQTDAENTDADAAAQLEQVTLVLQSNNERGGIADGEES